MRVLHVLSNWKWTERSEPAADLAAGQQRAGAQVFFACGRAPRPNRDAVAVRIRAKGLVATELDLNKHLHPCAGWRTLRGLGRLIADKQIDVVHAHMRNARLLGGLAARRHDGGVLVVATLYEPCAPRDSFRERWLLSRFTDGLVCTSQRARREILARFPIPPARVAFIEPPLDVDRFRESLDRDEVRRSFGLDTGNRVVGLVSRIRGSRRIDIVMRAAAILAAADPAFRLLVVGRGKKKAVNDEILNPAKAYGISERIVLAGYCREEELVRAYHAMDVLAYPFPGTDPSCRTVREAMAAGVPVVAARVGHLPALVEDGMTGLLADMNGDAFASAIGDLLGNPARQAACSRHARDTARERFALQQRAADCLAFYKSLA